MIRLAEVLAPRKLAEDAVKLLATRRRREPREEPRGSPRAGQLLRHLGRTDEAIDAFRDSVDVRPHFASGHGSLGMLLQGAGRLDEADQVFRHAIGLIPDHALLHVGHAHVLTEMKRHRRCRGRAAPRAGAQRPQRAGADVAGDAVQPRGSSHGIGPVAQRAAQIARRTRPTRNPPSAMRLHALGIMEQATQILLRGWQLSDSPTAGSNFLHHLNYVTNVVPAEVLKAHRSRAQRYADRIPLHKPHANDRDPERRLKIGYVSADFRRHAVSHFVEPLLAGHDRDRVEVYCYSAVAAPDEVTERLKLRVGEDHWRNVGG